jgi:hypothetical protein
MVLSDLQGMSVALVVTGIAHLLEVILIGHQGSGALVQEGLPLVFLVGVLSVCV